MLGSTLELLSDVVGWFRVGIGVTVAAPREDDDDAAAEQADAALGRLANSGGVLQVTAALPLLFRSQSQFNSTYGLMWTQQLGAETPAGGGFFENPAATYQTGLESIYERRGVEGRINFEFAVIARAYLFSDAYAAKAAIGERNTGFLVVPRIGFTLLDRTKIDVHWRVVRSDAFSGIGDIAMSLQQVTR